ncbi:MAG: AAA family ATPase [Chloroflexaceae bacterium]|nr:AAA family ATPase [Chloroflexaceae bacterium]
MPRRSSAKPPAFEQTDPFTRHVEDVLRHIHDPAWLGSESPLATPYLLGAHLQPNLSPRPLEPAQRGAVLRTVIDEALHAIDAPARRHITLRYIEEKRRDIIMDEMGMSVNTLMKHQRNAVQQLRDALLHVLRPALRAETPRRFTPLIGRAAVYQQSLAALQQAQTLTITGPSGIGKTTLASFLVQDCQHAPICWLTLRPGINDSFAGVAFALGYTLSLHQAGHLWQQLIATADTAESPEALLLVLRHDLHQLQSQGYTPMLCLDEIDLLRPSEILEHMRIVSLLEDLRGVIPLLLIGQQPLIDGDVLYQLAGLEAEAVLALCEQHQLQPSAHEVAQILAATRGNPRMIEFVLTLHTAETSLDETIQLFREAPNLEALFERVWRRLHPDEQALLAALSVFRRAAPAAAWHDAALGQLHGRHLLQADQLVGSRYCRSFAAFCSNACPRKSNNNASNRQPRSVSAMANIPKRHIISSRPSRPIWRCSCGRCIDATR